MEECDVAIIGGGPAGLSAALLLGRSLRTVVLIDNDRARNSAAKASHGYMTRDGVAPGELRRLAREELRQYPTVRLQQGTAKEACSVQGGFVIALSDGRQFASRKLVIATGFADHLPPIRGLRETYGSSVFPCPFCDGYERRNESTAVFGRGHKVYRFTKKLFNWSKDLAVFSDGPSELDQGEREELIQRGIRLFEEPIEELASRDGMLHSVILRGGAVIPRTSGFIADTGASEASDIPDGLLVARDKTGKFDTQAHGKTSVDGLYIIGDAKNAFTGLVGAAGEGYEAGTIIVQELAEEDWERCR
ncbi:NAD(P)/FAD-dependent oxidoreductase [Paenibacillus soyae]|uniref:NAD(P)/FAD-dependent oxidoreductase n=1 Tax=Paenibacillus soyae TaxID=2969249 RepID=A0A9X2MNB6_9BACL|nr:NAD(P)/FAD-dependent oxidoreductase [Paenibacillus soyae]MCR2802816.1 NAD(P)/FAD-dependent oxidoreductase [Paenibacillus soyae]